jgi:hypothetical protein
MCAEKSVERIGLFVSEEFVGLGLETLSPCFKALIGLERTREFFDARIVGRRHPNLYPAMSGKSEP